MTLSVSFAALLVPFTMLAGANTIYLRDGRTISGRFIDGNTGTIAFQDDGGREYRFRTGDVDRITFAPNQQFLNPSPVENAGYNGPAQILPVGTELRVRTTSTINSRDASENQVFPASIDRDVLDASGNVLIPRGSAAELVVRDANGGLYRESSNLILDVQAVFVNGQRFLINTEDLSQRGASRQGLGGNRRTGEFVGGGAALGSLLGAIAGGGKGALIGALAGAAAGVGAQVLTKGSEVRVPSETTLTFRIEEPVYMNMSPGFPR